MGQTRFQIGVCVVVLLSAAASYTRAQDTQSEFAIKKQYEMEKIDDFYLRLEELDRQAAERLKGEGEIRKERKKILADYEAARQEHVRLRKKQPPEDPTIWEREIKARARESELARKEFVRKRDEMNRVLKSVGKIPEEDEYDISVGTAEE